MSFAKLEAHEKKVAEAAAERAEAETRKALKRAVKAVIPKGALVPRRPQGRNPKGGLTRKQVEALRTEAASYLVGEAGLSALEAKVKHTALVILLIDGVLGTEPWRAAGGPHAGLIAANARLRYLENAVRILDDMRRSAGQSTPNDRLIEGVIDGEIVKP